MEKCPSRILYQGAIAITHDKKFYFACEGLSLQDRRVFLVINPSLTRKDLEEALQWRERYINRCPENERQNITKKIAEIRAEPDIWLENIRKLVSKYSNLSEQKTLAGEVEQKEIEGAHFAYSQAELEALAHWKKQSPIGNVPILTRMPEMTATLLDYHDRLHLNAQEILDYIPHIYLVANRPEYFKDISRENLEQPRSSRSSFNTFFVNSDEVVGKAAYIPPEAAIYRVIKLATVKQFGVFFEETKHAIHLHVGFSDTEWNNAAEEALKKQKSRAFLLQWGRKPNWMDDPLYQKTNTRGAELLVELDYALENLRETEKLSAVEALKRIIAEMPECGELFAEYKVKEAMLAQAYRDKNFDHAEDIRKGIIQPDISHLLPSAKNLADARQQTITALVKPRNDTP